MNALNQVAQRPSLTKILLETRAPFELGAYISALPLLQTAPRGDGHPVMIMPGFMASDASTLPLRLFLRSRGYTPYRWGQGRNYGRGIDLKEGVTKNTNIYRKLKHLREKHQRKVSLIGWSLGGVYARELAKLAPEDVRQVITLGSPFTNNIHANTVSGIFERVSGRKLEKFDPELFEKISQPPPVPSTAILSRSDGIAAWECCVERLTPTTENIEVQSSHTGLGHNPIVLWAIADRLAQPEGKWRPFNRSGLKSLFYRDPIASPSS